MAQTIVSPSLSEAISLKLNDKLLSNLKLEDQYLWKGPKEYIEIPAGSYIDTGVSFYNFVVTSNKYTVDVTTPHSYTYNYDCRSGSGTDSFLSSSKKTQTITGGPYASTSDAIYYEYTFQIPSNATNISVNITYTKRTATNEPSWVSSRTGNLIVNGTSYTGTSVSKTSTGTYTISTTQGGNAAGYGKITITYDIISTEQRMDTVITNTDYKIELDFEIDRNKIIEDKSYAWIFGGGDSNDIYQLGAIIDGRSTITGVSVRNFTKQNNNNNMSYNSDRQTLVIDRQKTYFKSNSSKTYSATPNSSAADFKRTLYLGGFHENTVSANNPTYGINNYPIKIYGFKVYMGNVLTYNFVPTVKGMKETINNTYHPIITINTPFAKFKEKSLITVKPGSAASFYNRYIGFGDKNPDGSYMINITTLNASNSWTINTYLYIPRNINSIAISAVNYVAQSQGGGSMGVEYDGTSYTLYTTSDGKVIQEKTIQLNPLNRIVQLYAYGSCSPRVSNKGNILYRFILS